MFSKKPDWCKEVRRKFNEAVKRAYWTSKDVDELKKRLRESD